MPQTIQLNILLADDDNIVRVSIAGFLAVRGHRVVEAENGMQALQHLNKDTFDVVITDIKMPGADGFAILNQSRQNKLNIGLHALIGQSPAIQSVKTLVQQVAQTEATSVLVTGETGTGKEVVARAIHHESSRSGNPFVGVDCTAVPDNLFKSAFYGHEKGAFTDAHETRQGYFEQANGGTLFLNEVGDMSPILNKPGRFEPHELAEMRKHNPYGEEILSEMGGITEENPLEKREIAHVLDPVKYKIDIEAYLKRIAG